MISEQLTETWSMDGVKNLHVSWPRPDGSRALVSDVLSTFQQHILDNYVKYEHLIVSMKDKGQVVPIKIFPDRKILRDGIHRIAIADSMNWNEMIVTVSGDSTWYSWDSSPIGEEYWKGVTR